MDRFTARVTTPDQLSESERACWIQLSTSVSSLSSPFLSLYYVKAAAEAGANVRVCVIYQGDKICGFLPFQFRNRISSWMKASEPAGGNMTDYFGLIADPDVRIDPSTLLHLAGINYFDFSHLDESQLNYGLLGETPRIGLRIRLDASASSPLRTLLEGRQKYAKDTERRARQLASEIGPIAFNFDVEQDRPAVLERLIDCKRSQYRRTNVADALKDAWKIRLLHRLSEYRFDTCRGVLSTLSAGDDWVAMHFGIVGNGTLQYWLPVYNPELAKYAPGRQLIHRIIDSCPAAAIHTIDRGEGDTASKRDLANDEHSFFRGVWKNRSASSQAAHSLQRIKWRFGA